MLSPNSVLGECSGQLTEITVMIKSVTVSLPPVLSLQLLNCYLLQKLHIPTRYGRRRNGQQVQQPGQDQGMQQDWGAVNQSRVHLTGAQQAQHHQAVALHLMA